jgi:hypothetical protein
MSNYKNENSKKQNSNYNIKDEDEKILYHKRQEIENCLFSSFRYYKKGYEYNE